MKKKLFDEIDRLKYSMINDLLKLISIPSKRGVSTDDAPYGLEAKNILLKARDILNREGFETKLVDNKLVYGNYGESKEYIGIFGHLDVVDEGDLTKWSSNPYMGDIRNNKIYGRGSLDNKGTSVAALYGLIALKNLGIIPKRSFRIVFGSNEEIGMDDIRHYLEVEDKPVMGFVPDNKFPAIYGERGRAVISINGNKERLKSFIKEYFSDRENITQKLGIDYEDEIFGKMILRGINTDLNLERGILKFSLSTPVCDIKEVLNLIKNKAGGLKVQILSWNEWEIKNKNSTNVMLLNQVYNEITGQNLVPTTTTGMTYAHYIKNVIPFGPSFPGQNGIAHLPNEWIDIEDLIKCAKIYADALYRYNEVEEIIK